MASTEVDVNVRGARQHVAGGTPSAPPGGHDGVSGAERQDQPAEGAAAQEAVRGVGPLQRQGMAQTRRDREQGQALQSQVGPGDSLTHCQIRFRSARDSKHRTFVRHITYNLES